MQSFLQINDAEKQKVKGTNFTRKGWMGKAYSVFICSL